MLQEKINHCNLQLKSCMQFSLQQSVSPVMGKFPSLSWQVQLYLQGNPSVCCSSDILRELQDPKTRLTFFERVFFFSWMIHNYVPGGETLSALCVLSLKHLGVSKELERSPAWGLRGANLQLNSTEINVPEDQAVPCLVSLSGLWDCCLVVCTILSRGGGRREPLY